MASFNKVILVGNLTRDPEWRYTPKGTAIAKIGLAVNRVWTNEAGEKKEEVTFVDVDVFGRTAENVGQYMRKGRPILIEGRLRLDQWDDKQTGQKKSKLGVVAETCDEVAVMYAGRIVERAPAAELFANPQHPYTIGLLAARPAPDVRHDGPLRTIPGMVPAPQHFPSGCRFHPRCAYARLPACQETAPTLDTLGSGHVVRCPFAADLGPPRATGHGDAA